MTGTGVGTIGYSIDSVVQIADTKIFVSHYYYYSHYLQLMTCNVINNFFIWIKKDAKTSILGQDTNIIYFNY